MQSLGGDLVIWIRKPPAASHMGDVWERQIRSAHAILSSLLSTYGKSLDKESLLTLVAETEGILKSWPLTVKTISNPTSDLPLAPSNTLTIKSKVFMPPPGDFSRPDLHCQKRWHRLQHIANEFWSSWRKEYLHSLQSQTKWQSEKRAMYWCTMVECTLIRLMMENWWILFFILCLFLWSLAKYCLPLLLCLYISIGN